MWAHGLLPCHGLVALRCCALLLFWTIVFCSSIFCVVVSPVNTDNISTHTLTRTQMTAIARISFWNGRVNFAESCTCKIREENKTHCFSFGFIFFFFFYFSIVVMVVISYLLIVLIVFNGRNVLYMQWCVQMFCHKNSTITFFSRFFFSSTSSAH